MARVININFDIAEVLDELGLSVPDGDELLRFVLQEATKHIDSTWRQVAGRELHRTRDIYRRAIQIQNVDRYTNEIVLRNIHPLPNMIESGAGAFDIKRGFEQSRKVKYTKSGGWYLTIPFRWGTPGAIGDNFVGIMPQEVYNIVKNLQSQKTVFKAGKVQGAEQLQNRDIPEPYRIPQARNAFTDLNSKRSFEQYQHKTPLLAGLQRSSGQYEKAMNQGQYTTFRRASSNSDPLSWIHRGIKQYNLAEKAIEQSDINTFVENTIDDFFTQ